MSNLILEDGSTQHKHRKHLNGLTLSTNGILRVASAYVTDRELFIGTPERERRLLISLSRMDVASGATSIETLVTLIESGVICRSLPERPRLHAKVYIFGTSRAVVTSANMTSSAFDSNIEVGVEVNSDQSNQLASWFDKLWEKAVPLTIPYLSELKGNTIPLRKEFMKLKRKKRAQRDVPDIHVQSEGLSDTLLDLFANAKHYFVCNTNRRYDQPTETGVYTIEEQMRNRGFAAAWETFKFPTHMKYVERGDAIFMFAKDIGIIGIGIAKDGCETLRRDDPDRISNFTDEDEWRVPVQWLEWTDEVGAYPWKSPNFTFWDVSSARYEEFRESVKTHFL